MMAVWHCRMPRENLEALLQMKLPSRTLAAEDDISADCCICYAYRLPTGNPSALGTESAGLISAVARGRVSFMDALSEGDP